MATWRGQKTLKNSGESLKTAFRRNKETKKNILIKLFKIKNNFRKTEKDYERA